MAYTSVLVAGAGPAGLTLACALRAAGAGVRVVAGPATRTPGPEPGDRAALGRLGVRPGSPEEVEPALRRRLEQLGVAVEPGPVTEVAEDDELVVARVGEDVVRAGWLVDCAGPAGRCGRRLRVAGIGDAENLGWKLAAVILGRAGADLLDTYAAERQLAIRRGSRAGSYRRGPLGSRWRPGGGALGRTLAGDLVPDLSCHRADGLPTRLHAELGGRWALLSAFANRASAIRPWLGEGVTDLRWPHTELALIRPDARLGWRGRDPQRLRHWLARVLGRTSTPAPILGR